jgi:hypothetical protein
LLADANSYWGLVPGDGERNFIRPDTYTEEELSNWVDGGAKIPRLATDHTGYIEKNELDEAFEVWSRLKRLQNLTNRPKDMKSFITKGAQFLLAWSATYSRETVCSHIQRIHVPGAPES